MPKTCRKCGKEKPFELFDKSSFTGDGYSNKCKLCESNRQALKYKNHKENISRKNHAWKEFNRSKISNYNKTHYSSNKEKYIARSIVNMAISRGDIKPLEKCEDCCGLSEHGHHEDYSKPMEVVWLCRSCHKRRHLLKKELAFSNKG